MLASGWSLDFTDLESLHFFLWTSLLVPLGSCSVPVKRASHWRSNEAFKWSTRETVAIRPCTVWAGDLRSQCFTVVADWGRFSGNVVICVACQPGGLCSTWGSANGSSHLLSPPWQIIANHHMQSISFASGGDPVSGLGLFLLSLLGTSEKKPCFKMRPWGHGTKVFYADYSETPIYCSGNSLVLGPGRFHSGENSILIKCMCSKES